MKNVRYWFWRRSIGMFGAKGIIYDMCFWNLVSSFVHSFPFLSFLLGLLCVITGNVISTEQRRITSSFLDSLVPPHSEAKGILFAFIPDIGFTLSFLSFNKNIVRRRMGFFTLSSVLSRKNHKSFSKRLVSQTNHQAPFQRWRHALVSHLAVSLIRKQVWFLGVTIFLMNRKASLNHSKFLRWLLLENER